MMLDREKPGGGAGSSNGIDSKRYHNTPYAHPAQSRNLIILQAIERLAAVPGTADIRLGLAEMLERPGGGNG